MSGRKKIKKGHLHNFLVPNPSNRFSPGIFSMASVVVIVLVLCAVQATFFFTTYHGGGSPLASVLPGVLENLTNNDRSLNDVPTVAPDDLLTKAAALKAQDMADKGYFAHVSPEGKTPWYWLDTVGYKYTYAGENLAINFTDSIDVENAWMHSPAHRANIVKAQYQRIGIGVAEGTYEGKSAIFVAQFFATPTLAFAKTLPGSAGAGSGSTAVGTSSVLGAEISPVATSPALGTLAGQIATSPHHVLIYTLSALGALIFLLLLVAVMARLRAGYVEVLGGGLVLLVAVLGFLIFNIKMVPGGAVGASSQGAAAVTAFAPHS